MKAVILAAGKGDRMLPLTRDIPKVLIEINGKPFLYYLLKNLQEAGYSDFGIIVGYKKEQIKEFLEKYNFRATLIEQKEQLGTAHAISLAEDFVNGENFICMVGDNLWSVDDLKAAAIEDNLNYIVGIKSKTPEKYGVLLSENGFLTAMPEKPKEFVGDVINTGLYKFTPEIFDAIRKIDKSPRGEYEINDAIMKLKVKVLTIKNYWLDLGCKEDIPKISKTLNKLSSNFYYDKR